MAYSQNFREWKIDNIFLEFVPEKKKKQSRNSLIWAHAAHPLPSAIILSSSKNLFKITEF